MRFKNGSLYFLWLLITALLIWGNSAAPALAGFTPTPPAPPPPTGIPATLQPPSTSVPSTPKSPPREKDPKDTPIPTAPAPLRPTQAVLPVSGSDSAGDTTVFGIALIATLGIGLMLAAARLYTIRND